jgi:D-cysteine desulfhydrase family pyridoxal phosphate-dependent enzyme
MEAPLEATTFETNLDAIPRVRLARLPTPLHEAVRLRDALGGDGRCPRILLKRDDMTDLALGGNKARKLEFLLADALARQATVLVTTGGLQSNHARMTAAAARVANMRAELVLTVDGAVADPKPAGNLLLDRILGAELHFVTGLDPQSAADAEEAKVAEVVATLEARGERPYVVALGGSCRIGALGYVQATGELLAQLEAIGAAPTRLYHASGSRGTQAGLELGARLFGATYRVMGVAVSGSEEEKRAKAARIMRETAALLGASVTVREDELYTDQDHYGEGYAIPTMAGVEAIRVLARTEGVFLDPVYTGKAMAGLISWARKGRLDGKRVVFVHTGGLPALFAYSEELAG